MVTRKHNGINYDDVGLQAQIRDQCNEVAVLAKGCTLKRENISFALPCLTLTKIYTHKMYLIVKVKQNLVNFFRKTFF